MIRKTENCLYCGEKMESITAKKKFCCDLHRVYWNREQKIKPFNPQKQFIDKNGNETSAAAGKPFTITLTEKDYMGYIESSKPNSEIEKQIADIQAEVKPSLISKEKFKKWQQKRISEIQNQLK